MSDSKPKEQEQTQVNPEEITVEASKEGPKPEERKKVEISEKEVKSSGSEKAGKPGEKPGKPEKPEMVPFSHFFMYSTASEKALLYCGYLACGLAGLLIPSVAIFMGEITVSFDPDSTVKETLKSIRRLNISIQIIGAVLWFFSYVFYSFWQHLAENVSFNLRERYIRKLMD